MTTPHSPPTTPPTANNNTTSTITTTTAAIPSHAEIPYSASFTTTLSQHLLSPTSTSRPPRQPIGIRILPSHPSSPPPESASLAQTSLPFSSIQETSLAQIDPTDLPLALDDPRRIYTSDIPGILLTHPGGFYEGGPCTDSSLPPPTVTPSPQSPTSPYHAFVHNFLSRHPEISTPSDLQRAIKEEAEAQMEVLRARLREREEGRLRNGEVERRVEALVADREVERKVLERWGKSGRGRG